MNAPLSFASSTPASAPALQPGSGTRAATVAAMAALVRSQAPAAAGTALYRNQLFHSTGADMDGAMVRDGARDFDFFFGRWRVRNERLKQRLVGSTDWVRFEAIIECRPILGGQGNLDEFVTDEFGPGVFHGMTLRLFDRATQRWSIWWASNRSGALEPAVIGSFVDGVGRFEGDDVHEGTPVRVRFVWSHIGADSARWEQAFSTDGGKSWETNWRMRMERIGAYRPEDGGVA
jgi:hypothetical protein